MWLARCTSHSVLGREDSFRNGVRARDKKCFITGVDNFEYLLDDWTAVHATHVFPLGHESLWVQRDYGRWITNMNGEGGSRIDSVQNGLLMNESFHTRFDQYQFSINADVSVSELELGLITLTQQG